MFNRRITLATILAAAMAGIGTAGRQTLDWLQRAPPPASFGQRYGGNPRSTRNGGQGRGAAARIQRLARKRNNIRKHARG